MGLSLSPRDTIHFLEQLLTLLRTARPKKTVPCPVARPRVAQIGEYALVKHALFIQVKTFNKNTIIPIIQ